jgi:hypothetical protein
VRVYFTEIVDAAAGDAPRSSDDRLRLRLARAMNPLRLMALVGRREEGEGAFQRTGGVPMIRAPGKFAVLLFVCLAAAAAT